MECSSMRLVDVVILDVPLLEGQRLLTGLHEGRDVLPAVLRPLRDELFIKRIVLALLSDVDACTISPAEEELRL